MRYTSLRVHSKQKFQKYDDFTFCTEDTRCSECGWKLCDIRSLVVRIPQQGCPSPTIEGTCDQVSFKSKKKRIRGFLYPPPPFLLNKGLYLSFEFLNKAVQAQLLKVQNVGACHSSLKNESGGSFTPSLFFSFFF